MYLLDYAGPSGFAAAVAQAVPSGRVYLLDHHKTAAEQLRGAALPRNLHVTLDQSRSGAQIALEHFQPEVCRMRACGLGLLAKVVSCSDMKLHAKQFQN